MLTQKQLDLQRRLNRYSELSSEIELYHQKLKDDPTGLSEFETEMDKLHNEIIQDFG